ncbi:hypothetical protein CMESO_164 (nucleomorph) [Chroomonas mesostigmatica CCMP1168]|uniref:Uncharacterized protein n=1 Tax=Chroomonas mesostigmatica CCMP1168 TaxID=1195612 RepID=J7GA39_9CRYP|nr:hypothetical protein CMESO_164 [Chroomonas mesostigmatica CCMP1168]|mmetsp:Transcript_78/g.187  ORF Transcript_78/g.187 Transcript_78/m.187 type:complete len:218 (+) Transcript_78:67-720(+)
MKRGFDFYLKKDVELRQLFIILLRISRDLIFSTLDKNKTIKIFPTYSFWFVIEKNYPESKKIQEYVLRENLNIIIFDSDINLFSKIKIRQKSSLKNNFKKFQNFITNLSSHSQFFLTDIVLQARAYNLFFVLINLLAENIFGNFVSFLDLINGVFRSYNFLNIYWKHLKFYIKKFFSDYRIRRLKRYFTKLNVRCKRFRKKLRGFFLFFFLTFVRMH